MSRYTHGGYKSMWHIAACDKLPQGKCSIDENAIAWFSERIARLRLACGQRNGHDDRSTPTHKAGGKSSRQKIVIDWTKRSNEIKKTSLKTL